jgi:aminoglycoside phosphotransferase family enzyme/predicted kinase
MPKPVRHAIAELSAADQTQMVQNLARRLAPHTGPVRHIETHISHVLLAGPDAYKFKKVLRTAFLDQSTRARRRHACKAEVTINRRLAPDWYLGTRRVTGSAQQPALDGAGPVLDTAVHMRTFDEAGLWDRLAAAGKLGPADVDALAERLARFHASAKPAPAKSRLGRPLQQRALVRAALQQLRQTLPPGPATALLDRIDAWEASSYARLAPLLAQRRTAGQVREGHGDLHLGNVARADGTVLAFDAIEFSAAMRWLDVMSDLAFMAMDLQAHGLHGLAHRFVDAYLQHTGDYEGLPVLAYQQVYRAAVRALVAQLRAHQQDPAAAGPPLHPDAWRYLQLAAKLTQERPRVWFITHGLSGSGKTTHSQSLLEQAGAVRVRADVERKRLAGLPALAKAADSSPGTPELYGPAMNQATYARLLTLGQTVVKAGWPVILDATFLRQADRQAARLAAQDAGVPFVLLHFEAPADILYQRVGQRAATGRDASDADARVVASQAVNAEPLTQEEATLAWCVTAARSPGTVPPTADWSVWLTQLGPALQTTPELKS